MINDMNDLPPYETLLHLYYTDDSAKVWRFGQFFINKYARDVTMPELFYEPDIKKAYKLVLDKFYPVT